jgi:hypothetical protein
MRDEVNILLRSASDSRAVVEVKGISPGEIAKLSVTLRGPTCAYARTLPADYTAVTHAENAGVEILLPDPCYWTPGLPFLYELQMGGEQRPIGLRRLTARRESLYWEGERIVLRGCRIGDVNRAIVPEVRMAEVALLISTPSDEQCDTADLHGLPLVADLRGSDVAVGDFARLAGRPSVAIMLLKGSQRLPSEWRQRPPGSLLAAAISPDDDRSALAPWCDVVVAEVGPGQRPAAWLVNCGKPVMAIRCGETYADLAQARAACDRLQAELAPEFDLAGYFV